MTQEIINVGSSPDDGSGDPLRTGFIKTNNNFSQLFSAILGNVSSLTYGNTSITIPVANGNIAVQVTGTSNVAVFSPNGQYVTGVISATGNITGNYLIGNGSQITGIGNSTAIVNGTSNVKIAVTNGNVTVGVGGSTIGTFASTGEYVTGIISATGNIKAAGFTFANGQPVSTGAQGSTGSQGATGTQGAVGTQGIQGTQGLTGTGSQGATGTQGIQGVQGAIATQGATGAQGIQGTTGTQGVQGIQGTTGTQGVQGIQGVSDRFATTSSTSLTIGLGLQSFTVGTGLSYTVAQDVIIAYDINNHMTGMVSSYNSGTGAMVVNVDTVIGSGTYASWTVNLNGAVGIQGTTGAQGIQGIAGVGTQGATGTQGTVGTQGIQGVTGVQGLQGVTGSQGTTGAQGTQGVQGITGAQGAIGTQGAVGTQGTTGAQGIQGTTGTQGATGTQGTTGTQGIQGIVGTQGAQGTQGITGIQGAQGIQGIQGIQGQVGPSTAINATDVTTGTLYPVLVGAAGSNQTANVDTVGLSFTATGNILSTTGNVVANNVIATTIVNAASHTGTIVSVSGNITGGNVTTAGIITVNSGAAATAIVNGAGNAVGNIGSSGTYFNRLFAQATTALYADLAEMYESDADYAPGTVVSFGGSKEVTLTQLSSDQRVAGVVSTNPAHIMNSGIQGEFTVAVALTGRVPTSVIGTVAKGDMMVSAGNGYAQASATPAMGTVIGKALQDHHGPTGIIEVVVGRM